MAYPFYMKSQTKGFTENIRAEVINWLFRIHLKFRLWPETLYITVNLMDRYLSLYDMPAEKVYLLAIAALLIATKYEEIYPPEVRDLVVAYIKEVCENYDVDGVEMDFFRHLNYFRTPASGKPATRLELDRMTETLRRIRTMTEERGVERGRPILISVRVPDSVGLSRALGLDVERWLEEGLIDLLAVTGYFRLNPWKASVDLGHKYGVPVYACLSESRMEAQPGGTARNTAECFRGRGADAWSSGMDGIYMFNLFDPTSRLWHELGETRTLAGLDKLYTTSARGLGGVESWCAGGAGFLSFDLLDPENTRALEPGKPASVKLRVGEEVDAGSQPSVTLQLVVQDLPDSTELAVRFNDVKLALQGSSERLQEFNVPASAVRRGDNLVEFLLAPHSQAGPVLEDLLLWVRYGKR